MSQYIIKQYTYDKARDLGVSVIPSKNPKKKIDVYKHDKFICSVGASAYSDYPTYLELERKGLVAKGTADTRRRLYKIRHKKDLGKIGTAGYYADKLLW